MTTRRSFLQHSATLGVIAGLGRVLPAYATMPAWRATRSAAGAGEYDLTIGDASIRIGDDLARATAINGTVPGPLLRFREGETATLRVTNQLADDTSIHWHGILLPPGMDGVPGVSFAGIPPGETFTYQFPLKQTGTYWYHSHSGFQEQTGVYGPLIVDPAGAESIEYDREYVIVLGDWTFEDPVKVMAKLKKMSGYYNFQRRTLGDFFSKPDDRADRFRWGRMRMDATDIADVTGHTYTYLINGMPPSANWTGLFAPGERVRLRFINAGAATFFDVRIPGLEMTVVQADGQDVKPVTVDEFRIAIAETYDVVVQPMEDQAYTIFAESMDRSGYASGTLAPREDMRAEIPERRVRPIRSMADMGMDMSEMDMPGMDMPDEETEEQAGHGNMPMPGMQDPAAGWPPEPVAHGPDRHGAGNSSVATMSSSRLHEPGVGLEDAGHRVLVYTDLRSTTPNHDHREPGREIELHLTGNMERYMWSFDGKKFSQARTPIEFEYGERLRLTFVNDTMMEHPIHLHGMWMELENGAGMDRPRKHTVNVKPAERLSALVTADAVGKWAMHCHILYHMDAGMFRVVEVVDRAAEE
ncbi:MAG: copper resistance system multicopper oxidase [Gemmatimonadota bacterium]